MRSEKQIIASRANGARSRGPKTPDGKGRSSRNAVRHELLAGITVLQEEPADAFRQLCQAYTERFGPLDEVEIGMIEEMVVTWWRMRRAWAIENRYFDTAMASQPSPIPADRLMEAFTGLADSNKLNLLHRYETRLHMMYQRAFRNLLTLRRNAVLQVPAASGRPLDPVEPPRAKDDPGPVVFRGAGLPACLLAEASPPNPPIPNEPKKSFPCNKSLPAEPKPNPTPTSHALAEHEIIEHG